MNKIQFYGDHHPDKKEIKEQWDWRVERKKREETTWRRRNSWMMRIGPECKVTSMDPLFCAL